MNTFNKLSRLIKSQGFVEATKVCINGVRKRVANVTRKHGYKKEFFEKIEHRKQLLRDSKDIKKYLSTMSKLRYERSLNLIAHLYSHDFYSAQVPELSDADEAVVFQHFVNKGFLSGMSPTTLFDSEFYFKTAGTTPTSATFCNWVLVDAQKDITPTPLFDDAWYNSHYENKKSGFYSYACLDVWNDYAPNALFSPLWYASKSGFVIPKNQLLEHYQANFREFGVRPSDTFPLIPQPVLQTLKKSPLENALIELDARYKKNAIEVDQAYLDLRRNYLEFKNKRSQLPADFEYSGRTGAIDWVASLFVESLGELSVDSVVIVNRLGMGGSVRISGLFCHALRELYPNENVLVIRADDSLNVRSDWFPSEVTSVALPDFTHDLTQKQKQESLFNVLNVLSPKRAVCINSLIGWELFATKGNELSNQMDLYGYDFCCLLNSAGKKTGFPISHTPRALPYLKALFLDNAYLRNDMIKANQFDSSMGDKIVVAYTPYEKPDTNFHWQSPTVEDNGQPKIFWAGRFDRQKRVDILLELARRNPQWDFWVWGDSMMNGPLDQLSMPSNLTLWGAYKSIDDIPLEKCNVWVYTSEWDGVPTQIVEVGYRAIPMVASRIWGTAELINEQTAYPVDKISDVASYEAGIRHFLTDTNAASLAGKSLKEAIVLQHDKEQYNRIVNAAIECSVSYENE